MLMMSYDVDMITSLDCWRRS